MKEKYLVYVDDDPDDRMLFKEAFDSMPEYKLLTLVNGFELLLFLKQRNQGELPYLIVLDINMPVMNGLEALSILKTNETYKKIPIVMFTTSANPEAVEYCKNLGTDIIIKPTKYSEIRNVFQELLYSLESN
jgi:CheY-like chemotaxis protein